VKHFTAPGWPLADATPGFALLLGADAVIEGLRQLQPVGA
jgi:hypothetical protein